MKNKYKNVIHYLNILKLFFLFLILLIIIFEKKVKINIYNKLKVCICVPGKFENLYIREFIEHYQNYGVDKIFLYDNNEKNGEKFEDIINDYIKNGYVEVINFRGKKRIQLEMMNDCYIKNYLNYDWLIFFDLDEFIYLRNFKNIKKFLNNGRFKKCQRIQLNWLFHTDNNLLYYDKRPIKERFKQKSKKARGVKTGGPQGIKSILRGHIPNITIKCPHILNRNLSSCDGFGRPTKIVGIVTEKSDFYYYYIDHYYCKSTEEFINKITKGDVLYKDGKMPKINNYFVLNEITLEKIELIEKSTGYNLSKFRKYIKKYSP